MDTGCTLTFADGTYHFALGLEQAIELERVTETPLAELEAQLRMATRITEDGGFQYIGGGPTVPAIRNTIRLGLIGGASGSVDGEEVDVGPSRAKELVEAYAFPARPLADSIALAAAIVFSAVWGIDLKKNEPENVDTEAGDSSSIKEPSSTIAESSGSTGEEQA